MATIPSAVLFASDLQVASAPLSAVLQGMLLGVLVALFAAAVVLSRAVAGLMQFARSVLGPPLTVFTALTVLALVLVVGNAAGI